MHPDEPVRAGAGLCEASVASVQEQAVAVLPTLAQGLAFLLIQYYYNKESGSYVHFLEKTRSHDPSGETEVIQGTPTQAPRPPSYYISGPTFTR